MGHPYVKHTSETVGNFNEKLYIADIFHRSFPINYYFAFTYVHVIVSKKINGVTCFYCGKTMIESKSHSRFTGMNFTEITMHIHQSQRNCKILRLKSKKQNENEHIEEKDKHWLVCRVCFFT